MIVRRIAESHPYIWRLAWAAAGAFAHVKPHDPSYLEIPRLLRGREGLILDIGANDGISSRAFRALAPKCAVLALEPNPCHVRKLSALAWRDPMFRCRVVAAGISPGRMTLHVPVYRGVALHTFAAPAERQVRRAVATAYGMKIANRCRLRSFEAEIVTIDSLDVSPVLIKIDAEGSDLAVLQGAAATIRRSRPVLILEWDPAMADRMDEIGYTVERTIGRNAICIPV